MGGPATAPTSLLTQLRRPTMPTPLRKIRALPSLEPPTLDLHEEVVNVPELDIRRLTFIIRGTSSYVSHAWSEKAKKLMAAGQSGEPRQGGKKREGRNPQEEY